MKLADRLKRKRIWIALVVTLAILAVAGGSYAAYISQDAQRGVARNRDTDRIRFSSNYLQPANNEDENQYTGKIIAYSKNTSLDTDITIDIYIYNYVAGSTSIVNEKDITYDMSIKLVDGTQKIYQVKYENELLTQAENDNSLIFEKKNVTLTGRVPKQHHYTVQVKGEDLDKIRIIAKAVPSNKSYTGNQFLAATIAPSTASEVKEFFCEGTFTDEGNGNPSDYDAFNYEVSISGGQAEVTLSWDSSLVEIDPYFLDKIEKKKDNITTGSDNWKILKFEMNQNNGTGDYLIPFYKLSGTSQSSWEKMKEVIKVSGKQIIPTQNQTQTNEE